MDTPGNDNSNNVTPYEVEKPYYDVDSAPCINNEITPQNNTQNIQYNTNNPENNNNTIKCKPKNDDLNDYKKRIFFAIILLLICIIDIIMQFFLDYLCIYAIIDDIAVTIIVFSFFCNFLVNKTVKLNNACIVILFIFIWVGGFVFKLMAYKNIIDSDNNIITKVIISIVHLILIIGRIIGLIITFSN